MAIPHKKKQARAKTDDHSGQYNKHNQFHAIESAANAIQLAKYTVNEKVEVETLFWRVTPPLAAAVLTILFVSLGFWQLDRAAEKVAMQRLYDADAGYTPLSEGMSVRDYQRIERQDDGFFHDGTQIPAETVENLVQSIAHLHPQPHMQNTTTHTDDYPFWAIELTDLDGNVVLLYSESNTPNFSPWNVAYQGEIFTQYNGEIATALAGLLIVSRVRTGFDLVG
jgi:hypothetical protein